MFSHSIPCQTHQLISITIKLTFTSPITCWLKTWDVDRRFQRSQRFSTSTIILGSRMPLPCYPRIQPHPLVLHQKMQPPKKRNPSLGSLRITNTPPCRHVLAPASRIRTKTRRDITPQRKHQHTDMTQLKRIHFPYICLV